MQHAVCEAQATAIMEDCFESSAVPIIDLGHLCDLFEPLNLSRLTRTQSVCNSIAAVNHVFDITELLEAVLMQLDFSGKVFHTFRSLDEEFQQPVVQLFALRRVNRMLRATIDGSPRLREKMGLILKSLVPEMEPTIGFCGSGGCFPCDYYAITMYYGPLYWVLAHLRMSRQPGPSHCWPPGLTLNGPDRVEWCIPARTAASLHRKYASWRQIKMAGYTNAPSFKIHLLQVMAARSELNIQPGGEATLGDFYDCLIQEIAEWEEYDRMIRLEADSKEYS